MAEEDEKEVPASLIINRLVGLTSSGALNLFSESSAKMMWGCLFDHSKFFSVYSTENPVLLSELLSRLCGALDSFRLAGLFLGVAFRAAVLTSACSSEFIVKLLYLLSQTEEVAMLDGSKEQLVWQLQLELSEGSTTNKEIKKLIKMVSSEEVKNQVLENLKAVEGDEDDEDADEEGNLEGFVTYSDEEEEEEDDDDDDDDDDDEEEEDGGEEEEEEEEDEEVKNRTTVSNKKRKRSIEDDEKESNLQPHPTHKKQKGSRLRRVGGGSREDNDSSDDDSSLSPPLLQREAKSRMGRALAALND